MTKKQIAICCLNTIVPLGIGTLYYVLFRPESYIGQIVTNLYDVSYLRQITHNYLANKVVSFYMCDVLWAYSLGWFMMAIARDLLSARLSFCIITFFEIVVEFFQMFNIISGTFDWFDIFFEMLATMIAIYFAQKEIGGN